MADVVHKSAHPDLPPAAPQQVVQYLLAKNFHLTALELLVEAQQAGHGDDVRVLEAFFSDPDRFPPEELARYQPGNALDLQAAGRERESQLQLVEYELRLAKEDLAEMARKLAQERQQQMQLPAPSSTSGAAAAPAGASTATAGTSPSPSSPDAAPPSLGHRPGPAPSSAAAPGAAPSPAEQRALNAAVFAHLLRQGLVTTAMTMEEEYGGPLRATGSAFSTGAATHGSAADAEQPWELWSWYRAAAGAPAVAVDGDAATAAAAAPSAVGTSAPGAAVDPDDLVRQYGLLDPDPMAAAKFSMTAEPKSAAAAEMMVESVAGTNGGEAPLMPQPAEAGEAEERLRADLRAAREELATTRARARAAVAAAVSAATAAAAAAAAQQQQQSKPAPPSLQSPSQQPLSYISADADVLDLLDIGSSATSGKQTAAPAVPEAVHAGRGEAVLELDDGRAAATPSPAAAAAAAEADGAEERSEAAAAAETATHGSLRDEDQAAAAAAAAPPWRRIDPAFHASLERLLGGVCDMLPRLVPNMNLKSRLEVLPLIVSAAKTSPDWAVRRQLLVAVFNLVPAPDYQQRQAIIDASLELCQAFGSGWAATELVQLCCRQVGSPSSERRMLVAEALGEAVGAVDAGTQAHVLLTQLSQLAKDRLEQVREAACHSLARLVPRLPFTPSYYTTLEGLLLPLATDASEGVHVAALTYLVPALLTWQPQDTDSVLVSSCLARVLSEMSQQVRIIEQYQQHFFNHLHYQQQQQALKAAAADGGSGGGGGGSSFAGTFLRYSSHRAPASPSPAPPAPAPLPLQQQQPQRPPEDQAGGGSGGAAAAAATGSGTRGSSSSLSDVGAGPAQSTTSAGPPPSPPPPPPQWVTFGRRSFPSASHLLLYQLLALYGGLAPALRHAALSSRPEWARPPGFEPGAGGRAGGTVAAAAAAATSGAVAAPDGSARRPHRTGSFGESSSAAGGGGAAAAAAAAVRDPSDLPSAAHRRTSSHPVFGERGPLAAFGAGGADGGVRASAGVQTGRLIGRASLQHQQVGSLDQIPMPKSSSSSALAADGAAAAAAAAGPTRPSDGEGCTPAGGVDGGDGEAQEGPFAGPHWSRVAAEEAEEAEEGAGAAPEDRVRAEEDASLAAWASHAQQGSWKTLEWLVQHVMPELIRLTCCVGPMFPEALEVRRQAACAVACTCSALGSAFTQAVIEPVFLTAAGAGASTVVAPGGGGGGGSVTSGSLVMVAVADSDSWPPAVRDTCAVVQPRTPEALRMARQCVLPVLLVSVLPASRRLRPHLLQLMGSAHELRQRWLMEALPDYTAALTFACSQRPDLLPQVLHVLEDLLSGRADACGPAKAMGSQHVSGDAAVADVKPAAAATAVAAGPASTHVGLCCAALARALVPVASLELASRRLLPGLMALMSYGEPDLQRACVGVLAELGLRFRGDGPRVSEQVLAVYDSLLEQGSHGVQLEVLAAGTALAAAAAPSAAVAAAAAAQVEWLLTAVQVVTARLTAPSAGGAAAAAAVVGGPTLEQQRALAAQLLAALRSVASYDLRLPRLQANLNAALDSVQRCKALLPDPQQQAALAALLKERPTGQSTAGASVSSTPPAAATAVSAAAAAQQVANATPLRTGGAPPLPPLPVYESPSAHASGVNATPTLAAPGGAGMMNPFLPSSGVTPMTHGSAQQQGAHGTPDGSGQPGAAGASGQLRSRFDAFRQRLMRRRDDVPATTPPGAAAMAAGGGRSNESFFSDDEGE